MNLTGEQGRVVYSYKRPFRDGPTHVVLEPLDFMARLAALVPRPRLNLTRRIGSINHPFPILGKYLFPRIRILLAAAGLFPAASGVGAMTKQSANTYNDPVTNKRTPTQLGFSYGIGLFPLMHFYWPSSILGQHGQQARPTSGHPHN